MKEERLKKWEGTGLALTAGLIGLLFYRLISYAVALIISEISPSGHIPNAVVIIFATLITSLGIIFFPLKLNGQSTAKRVGLGNFKITGLVIGLIIGVAVNMLTVSLVSILPLPESWTEANRESVNLVKQYCPVWVSAVASYAAAPFIEELLFRGLMFRSGRIEGNFLILAAVSSAIFGIIHGNVLQALYAAVAGAVFTVIVECTGSLWSSIGAHTAYNAGNIISALLTTLIGSVGTLIIGIVFLTGGMILLFTERKPNAEGEEK